MSRRVVVDAVGEEGSDIKEVRRYRDCGTTSHDRVSLKVLNRFLQSLP